MECETFLRSRLDFLQKQIADLDGELAILNSDLQELETKGAIGEYIQLLETYTARQEILRRFLREAMDLSIRLVEEIERQQMDTMIAEGAEGEQHADAAGFQEVAGHQPDEGFLQEAAGHQPDDGFLQEVAGHQETPDY